MNRQQQEQEYFVVAVVMMEDEPIHTSTHPFCSDLHCPCHEDWQLIHDYIAEPLMSGLLTETECIRMYQNRQVA